MKINIVLILLAASALSCAPEIKPRDADLGKESTPEEYNKAIDDAFANISLGNAKKGQYVSYIDNYQIERGNIMTHSLTNQKLTDIKEDEMTIRFVFFKDYWEYELGSDPLEVIDEKHSEYSLQFTKAPPITSFFAKATTAAEPCDGQDITDEEGHVYDCIKYFNLNSESKRITPPAAVRAKPDCMGLTDCLMNIHYLKYDKVKWRNGKSVSTITIVAEIAREVADLMYDDAGNSLLPPINQFCVHNLKLQDGRSYSHCTFLRDFE